MSKVANHPGWFARLWTKILAGQWLVPALWTVLALLVASLFLLAAFLLVKTGFFSTEELNDERIKALWAFLGVALGAAVTLIGALLTEQHNRRTASLTHEANMREERENERKNDLAREAEERSHIDTVTKVLGLVTVNGDYAKPARIAGAVATLMELRGGTVALRILGQLWKEDAIDSDTAVWLIDRILQGSPEHSDVEVRDALSLLFVNSNKLFPDDVHQVEYFWPTELEADDWMERISAANAQTVVSTCTRVLLSRRISFWKEWGQPQVILTMISAVAFNEHSAAYVILSLARSGALTALGVSIDDELLEKAQVLSAYWQPAPWFEKVLDNIEPWASGSPVSEPGPPMPGVPASMLGPSVGEREAFGPDET